MYEDADMGAYSIQVEQARRFALLVGNYSREKFNHPGPAFLYVQAWGEDLFYALPRTTPTARVADPSWEFMLTSQFICPHKGILDGRRFRAWLPGRFRAVYRCCPGFGGA